MVLETVSSCQERMKLPALSSCQPCQIRARLLATQYSNSAFQGAALDWKHITSELKCFLNHVELVHGIGKTEIATQGEFSRTKHLPTPHLLQAAQATRWQRSLSAP